MLDEHGRDERHKLLWAGARTLLELGELTAQWLEGGITYLPGYLGSGPDRETAELTPLLAGANRSGFVTTVSQPGAPLVNGGGQRAAVSGFCSEGMRWRLSDATFGTDLVIVACEPGAGSGRQTCIAVTVDGGAEYSYLTSPADYGEDADPGVVSAAGLAALRAAWQVSVFDPHWGRNDLLWDAIRGLGRGRGGG